LVKLPNSWKSNRNKIIAVAVALLVLILLPLVIESEYVKHLLIMACIGTVLGMTFSMLFSTGLITLGAGAFYAVGAYISALLAMNLGLSFWVNLPLTIIISSLLALGLGAIFVRNGGIAFVIISLLFANVVVIAAGQSEFMGGWGGIIGIPRPTPIGPIEFTNKTSFYYLAVALMLLFILIYIAIYSSRIGRAWRAIKLSPNLAGTLGINLYRYRLLAYVIGSATAAGMGSFYAHYFQTITPNSFSGWLSIYIQLYSVLGGLEFYILGPAVGAIIMTFIPEYLRVIKEIEPIITGALLLVVILFFPGGMLGSIVNADAFKWNNIVQRFNKIRSWIVRAR
jgi:branched-chain amino acid transport system permease protein